MLLNEYEQQQRRIISHYSRRSKSLEELQGRLKERGIKMKYTAGARQRIVFSTQRNFRIDSKLGKDRVFTNIARKNVDRNAKLSTVRKTEISGKKEFNQYARFDKLQAQRLEKTRDKIRENYQGLRK